MMPCCGRSAVPVMPTNLYSPRSQATNANMSPYLQSFRSHRKSVYARTAAASGAGEAGGPEGAAAASGTAGGGGVVLGGGAAGRRPRASAVAGAS